MSNVVNEIEDQRIQAKNLFLAGDYVGAANIATLTLGDLAIIPDGEKQGDAGAKLTWDREAIQAFIDLCKEKANSAATQSLPGGIAISQVEYVREC